MTPLPNPNPAIDLSGAWTLTSAEGDVTAPITLPGDVHSALRAAGLIPDPYAGRPAYYGDDDGRRHHGHGGHRRRKSFFEELFD